MSTERLAEGARHGVAVTPGEPAVIAPEALDTLIIALKDRGYVVIGPTVHDGAIRLGELDSAADLPVGWTDEQEAGNYRLVRRDDSPDDEALFGYAVGPDSMRRFLSQPRRALWSADREGGALTVRPSSTPDTRYAFVGVRACEIAAVAVQDRVFAGGRFPDPAYTALRERIFVVGVSCGAPAATCFCASTGSGPGVDAGYDLALTELLDGGGHRLVVEVGSSKGADVLTELPAAPASPADREAARAVVTASASAMTRRLDPEAARDALAANLKHPRWDEVAARCLSCANCTLVCPTCFCSATEHVLSLDGTVAEAVQHYDSCLALAHSYVHGVGPVRADIRSRYRQWLTHKLSSWWDQFGVSGCVGCGRCITWCPVGIDLTEEVAAISGDVLAGLGAEGGAR